MQIHDLHAKYQAAVNKAENVAEALHEQSKNKDANHGGTVVSLDTFNSGVAGGGGGGRFRRSLPRMIFNTRLY